MFIIGRYIYEEKNNCKFKEREIFYSRIIYSKKKKKINDRYHQQQMRRSESE